MGCCGGIGRPVPLHLLHQLSVCAVIAGRNHYKGYYLLASVSLLLYAGNRLQKEVYSLVLILIPSAYAYKQSIHRIVYAVHCRGHLKQQLASLRTLAVILLRSRHYAVLKAVWRYDGRHSAQKLHSLPCGNVAYSCKDIRIVGCALLQRVARGNIKPAGHLISIVGVKLAVERQVVAAYATAHHCCVCGKDRAYSKIAAL